MLKLIVALFVALIIAIPLVASKYLPWWGVLLVLSAEIVLLIAAGPKLIAMLLKQILVGVFEKKSRVLRGAQVEFHLIEPTNRPADLEQADESESQNRYVLIDFTITPPAPQGPMTYYEPSEILLVPYDAKVTMSEDSSEDEGSASIVKIRLIEEGGQETEDFDKVTGPQRFRAVFAVPKELSGRVKLRYYFEAFGDLLLP